MPIREATERDAGALHEFFTSLPAEDRTFFWEDVNDPAVATRWASDDRRSPMCAIDENGRLAAFAALIPAAEWSSHVAELVLVVARWARRQGFGRALANAMLLAALRAGFTKVTVHVVADQAAVIAMFQGIGFQVEALLRDHLRSPETGQMHDLVILSHLVSETYPTMVAAGLDHATG